jgi:hypothetical protein
VLTGPLGVCMRVRACLRACLRATLLIQRAKSDIHIVTSLETPLAPTYFSALSHERHDFRERGIEHKIRHFIFSTRFV